MTSKLFDRQLRLKEVGARGQAKLAASRVLVVGLGALGNPAAMYLAAAGVGTLALCDFDRVEPSNIHRQPLFGLADEGALKIEVSARELSRRYPDLVVEQLELRFSGDFPPARLASYDLVLDCCDNFSGRFAIHDLCRRAGVDLVSSAVQGFSGQLVRFPFSDPSYEGACLRCLYPSAPADGCAGSCAEDGILGAAAGILGSAAALVALEQLLGAESIEVGTNHLFDLRSFEVQALRIPKNPDCGVCGTGPTPVERVLAQPPAPQRASGSGAFASTSTATSRIIDIRQAFEAQPLDRILLSGAESIPMSDWLSGLAELPKDVTYILVCEHGSRSNTAMRIMRDQGFEQVFSLDGGFAELRGKLETVSGVSAR